MGYLSAAQLDITAAERRWLLHTKKVLEKMNPASTRRVDGLQIGFRMSTILVKDSNNDRGERCGTAGCIKGWMGCLAVCGGEMYLGLTVVKQNLRRRFDQIGSCAINWNESHALACLFYSDYADFDKVTPKIAAHAIGSFLCGMTGESIDWGDASLNLAEA